MNAPREPAPAPVLPAPARPAMRLDQVDTPALLLDLASSPASPPCAARRPCPVHLRSALLTWPVSRAARPY
jgi:hypothetical protein